MAALADIHGDAFATREEYERMERGESWIDEPPRMTIAEIYAEDERTIARIHIMERFFPETCPMLAQIYEHEETEKARIRKQKNKKPSRE